MTDLPTLIAQARAARPYCPHVRALADELEKATSMPDGSTLQDFMNMEIAKHGDNPNWRNVVFNVSALWATRIRQVALSETTPSAS